MPKTKLQELKAQAAEKDTRIKALFDAADARGDGVNTKEELSEIKKLTGEIEAMGPELVELEEVEAIKRANGERIKDYNAPSRSWPHGNGGDGASQQPFTGTKSIGAEVIENPEMQEFLKRFKDGFGLSGGVRIESPKVEVKTLVVGLSSPLVNQDRKPIVDSAYARPLTIRDIITVGRTDSDTVEYVRQNSVTNNAAPVAEATATSDGTGAKPESAMTFQLISELAKTIAHWIPATTRALQDAGQLETYINTFLRYGLEEELEDQILTGNGAGQNFDGILHVSGTTPQAFDTNILTTTRKARTKVRVTGRATPTAWVMNPSDWETFDLTEDNEARYYFGGPREMGQPRLWGLPVVESEGMTAGTAVVADWRLAVLWERLQAMVSMSNSHSDFFVRNLIAILAEMRAVFGVIRPAAFVLADLTA
jgi:HK97 family phage major capsid protein